MKINVGSVGLPLAAGLVASRLQGHTMAAKDHPLQRAGYDYGDTLWGTGEGWGYFSPVRCMIIELVHELFTSFIFSLQEIVPGFAALGGGLASDTTYAIQKAIDIQEEQNLADEEATYELPKNEVEETAEGVLIDHRDDDDDDNGERKNDEEEEESGGEYDDEAGGEDIEDELRMIDSDGDK